MGEAQEQVSHNAFTLITAVYDSERFSTEYSGVLFRMRSNRMQQCPLQHECQSFRLNVNIAASCSEGMSTFHLTVGCGFFFRIHANLLQRTPFSGNTVNGYFLPRSCRNENHQLRFPFPNTCVSFRMNASASRILSTDA